MADREHSRCKERKEEKPHAGGILKPVRSQRERGISPLTNRTEQQPNKKGEKNHEVSLKLEQ